MGSVDSPAPASCSGQQSDFPRISSGPVYTPAQAPAPRPAHSDQLAAGWGMFACYVGCSELEFAKISNVTVPCKEVLP